MTCEPVHFLLVDDLEENLLALEALLRREGLVQLMARSGVEALELLLKYDVALALVDVQMPDMDGFELAELIRGTERTRRIPIIFLTAGGPDPQRRFRGYEAGAVDYIRKPIEPDVLRSKADVFFELYRQRQEVARQRDELRKAADEIARLLKESRGHAEALQQADVRKDEFLATLAHELRNPLAPIRNAVELMRSMGPLDDSLEWVREIIDRQVCNMARLVDDLLDVSRIATGKLVLRRQVTELAPIVARAVETVRAQIDSKQHHLEMELPPQPVYLDADEIRIIQVFSNLLSNATKYTDPGGRIRLAARLVDDQVEVTVSDNGVGIPPEKLGDIFGLFFQLDRSLDRMQGGLGVGLALVKRLVELHGGSIQAHSSGLGHGSTFTVRLPVIPSPDQRGGAGADARLGSSRRRTGAGRRILTVDDNVDGAESFARILKMMGHEAVTAHTGSEGLEVARSFRPEVVFLDIGLPEISGYEVARQLRQDPQLCKATLVAMTGFGTEMDKRRASQAGFDFHLTKPVEPAAVRSILAGLAN